MDQTGRIVARAAATSTGECPRCREAVDDASAAMGPNGARYHAHCLRLLLELPGTPPRCRQCGAEAGVWIDINQVVVNPCPRCGAGEPVGSVICEWCGIRLFDFQSRKRRMHLGCYLLQSRVAGIFGSWPVFGFFATVAASYVVGIVLAIWKGWPAIFLCGVLGFFLGLVVAVVVAAWRAIVD